MTWVDLAINFAFGLAGGAIVTRWGYRAGFDRGRRIGFEEGKAAGWRGANDGLAGAILDHVAAGMSPQKASTN